MWTEVRDSTCSPERQGEGSPDQAAGHKGGQRPEADACIPSHRKAGDARILLGEQGGVGDSNAELTACLAHRALRPRRLLCLAGTPALQSSYSVTKSLEPCAASCQDLVLKSCAPGSMGQGRAERAKQCCAA